MEPYKLVFQEMSPQNGGVGDSMSSCRVLGVSVASGEAAAEAQRRLGSFGPKHTSHVYFKA